jgi:alkylated DNA repair dioxygenase AlkB
MSKPIQLPLFGEDMAATLLPDGATYVANIITQRQEAAAAREIAALDLKPFAFRGFEGNRRTASFGWRYDFNGGGLQRANAMPTFLGPLRHRAAELAGLDAAELEHVLVTEYGPRAGIGWHRDRPQFGKVIAISLLGWCRLRFRRKIAEGWERLSQAVEPRSCYVLEGPAREEWEHSIPPVDALRYSLTFRTMRAKA